MTGGWRALLRLFAVQGTWNYERMLGVGMGYAAEPLLEDLKRSTRCGTPRRSCARRSSSTAIPNLAGLALGATARAEYEAVPGAQVARLRTALCSPLGALGDQLFWAGLVPALVGLALAAVVLGAGWWAVVGLCVAYNWCGPAPRCGRSSTGLEAGMRVGDGDRRLVAAARGGGARPAAGLRRRARDAAGGRVVSRAWLAPGPSALAVAAVGASVSRLVRPAP